MIIRQVFPVACGGCHRQTAKAVSRQGSFLLRSPAAFAASCPNIFPETPLPAKQPCCFAAFLRLQIDSGAVSPYNKDTFFQDLPRHPEPPDRIGRPSAPAPEANRGVVVALPGRPLPPPAAPSSASREEHLAACVQFELLEQELRSLETVFAAAYDRLATTEPSARRAAAIRQIQAKADMQFEVLLRLTGTLTRPAPPPGSERA